MTEAVAAAVEAAVVVVLGGEVKADMAAEVAIVATVATVLVVITTRWAWRPGARRSGEVAAEAGGAK